MQVLRRRRNPDFSIHRDATAGTKLVRTAQGDAESTFQREHDDANWNAMFGRDRDAAQDRIPASRREARQLRDGTGRRRQANRLPARLRSLPTVHHARGPTATREEGGRILRNGSIRFGERAHAKGARPPRRSVESPVHVGRVSKRRATVEEVARQGRGENARFSKTANFYQLPCR